VTEGYVPQEVGGIKFEAEIGPRCDEELVEQLGRPLAERAWSGSNRCLRSSMDLIPSANAMTLREYLSSAAYIHQAEISKKTRAG